MPFSALSVNISPASFLKYTTYSSNTVVSPMMTKIIGGAVISEKYSRYNSQYRRENAHSVQLTSAAIIISSR